jgi:ABC-type branched-subunit amino acid transport system ATPase component
VSLLEVDSISMSFGAMNVLKTVGFSLEPGSITGIIGPNGAGKTTLFNVINGMYSPSSGRITLCNSDITGKSVDSIARSGIGRTFQVARVFGEMTLVENLLVAARASGLPRRDAQERSIELLSLARLSHLAEKTAFEISGGQKKLLEFVRTLIRNPQLVLLDEPFNGVSPALIEVLVDMVLRLNESRGTTFLLISHEMPHVARLCRSVIVMSEGTVIARETPEEAKSNPAVISAYLGR